MRNVASRKSLAAVQGSNQFEGRLRYKMKQHQIVVTDFRETMPVPTKIEGHGPHFDPIAFALQDKDVVVHVFIVLA